MAKFIELMCWCLLRLHFLNKEMLGEQFRKFTAVDIANRVKHVILPLSNSTSK